jgi:PAS domain S-box-containing protein
MAKAATATERLRSEVAALRAQVARLENAAVERERAEQLLEARATRLRTILEVEPECVKVIAADGTILEMNPAGLAILEADSLEQVIGQSVYLVIAPPHQAAFRTLLKQVLNGQPGVLEFECIGLKGSRYWLETHAVLLQHTETDRLVLSITRDITARKRAEAERDALLVREQRTRAVAEAAHQRFATLVQELDAIVWEGDPSTLQFTFVSARAESLLGYPVERWLTEPDFWATLLHPDDRARIIDECRASIAAGTEHPLEYRVVAAGGQIVWLRDIVRVVRDAAGRPQQFGGLMVDITERKLAEQTLRDREERWEAHFQGIPMPTYSWQKVDEDFILRACNAAAREITEGRVDDLIGKTARELYPDIPQLLDDFFDCYASQTTVRRALPYRLRTTGETREFLVCCVYVPPDLIMVHTDDITLRKQAAEALRVSEARYRRIVETAQEGIWTTDVQGATTYANGKMAEMLGYTLDELLGVPMVAFIDPQWRQMAEANMEGRHPGVAGQYECKMRRKDSALLWVSLSTNPLYDEAGRYIGALAMVMDISARKEAEAQLQIFMRTEKLRAIGQMAAGVAHDLNQYLALIAGHGELALQNLDSQALDLVSVRDALRTVVRSAMDGADTVKRLLAFARPPQAGPTQRIDVGDLLQQVATFTAPQWRDATQAQGRSIGVQVLASKDLLIEGRPESLREAVANLVLNAVDALPQGGTICLRARRRRGRIEVEVRDSGIGMSPEVRARVFEPFFSTKGEGGTGLGLALVFGIVDQHAGRITVDSAPGQGSAFRISFPAASAGTREIEAATPVEKMFPRRILAVDDDPQVGHMVAAMLAPAGHTVVLATSAKEALERLAAEPFDLIISDVGMPGMNGWELAEQVHSQQPGLAVVLATGWGAAIDPEDARAHGIRAVLAKPYRMADLLRVAATSF